MRSLLTIVLLLLATLLQTTLAWLARTTPLQISILSLNRPTSCRKRIVRKATIEVDDSEARSNFGTKEYWDEVYTGRGDFPSEEYSWYYGWDVVGRHVRDFVNRHAPVLIPGIGNDPILLDLLGAGYRNLTAQDYSAYAIERQQDLLLYHGDTSMIELHQSDVRLLPADWTNKYAAILEKGLLDAVYLSGDGHVEAAVESLSRTLRPGGIIVSVSGVVPEELRRDLFDTSHWTWVRDGSSDLKAGCFIFQKK